jgi:hypothetical protein
VNVHDVLRDAVARIIFAREAIELGERGVAVAVLRDLEADLLTTGRRSRCDRCGLRFRLPGDLDHHLRFSHGVESEDAA